MKNTLDTPRLHFREIRLEDAPALFALDSDPEVMRFLGMDPLTDISQTLTVIASIQAQYEQYGIGRWAAIEKASGACIGWAGLKFIEELNGVKRTHDLGYRFLKSSWGKGYATEAAKAFIDFGFREMNLPRITAYADVNHKASRAVLEKCGLRAGNTFEDSGDLCVWYAIEHPNHS